MFLSSLSLCVKVPRVDLVDPAKLSNHLTLTETIRDKLVFPNDDKASSACHRTETAN